MATMFQLSEDLCVQYNNQSVPNDHAPVWFYVPHLANREICELHLTFLNRLPHFSQSEATGNNSVATCGYG